MPLDSQHRGSPCRSAGHLKATVLKRVEIARKLHTMEKDSSILFGQESSIGWRYATRIHQSPDVSAASRGNKLSAILDWGRRPRAEQQEQLDFRHRPWQLNISCKQIRVILKRGARQCILFWRCCKTWRGRSPLCSLTPGENVALRSNASSWKMVFPFAAATVRLEWLCRPRSHS